MNGDLSRLLLNVIESYASARTEPFKGNPWRKWLTASATAVLKQLADANALKVRTGSGQGSWPEVPWIGLSHERLAENSQRGIYIAFLFNVNLYGFTLSLQQGISAMKNA